MGYFERDKTLNWEPEEALTHFLQQHEKIVFISFGSMTNAKPAVITKAIVEVLEKHKIPAILNTSWGGLEKTATTADHLLFVQDLPYDWIFPRVYAAVHHGGSGTTHSALKYGCPALIIPHIVDQPYWSKTLSDLQLGPKGIPIKKLNANRFEKGILELRNNAVYRTNAAAVAAQMKAESDPETLVNSILS